MAKKTLLVEGMSCAACSQTVEKTAGKVPGVTHAAVNLATEKLNIEYDESTFSLDELQQAVGDSGYQVVPQESAAQTFAVEGMTCASCAQTVEKAAAKLNGVEEASVNLATEKMTITYNPLEVAPYNITAAVEAAGYGAVLETASTMRRLWHKLISALPSVPGQMWLSSPQTSF